MKQITTYLSLFSFYTIPLFVLIILGWGLYKEVDIYEAFISGAEETFGLIKKIFPPLLAMLMAINIFFASGMMEILISQMKSIFNNFNIPPAVVPLAVLRPLSGSGSLAYVAQILEQFGPDSFLGRMASTIQGSTETTFYVIAIYFGSIKVNKYSYAVIVGLLADLAGFLAAVFICNLLF